MMEEAQLREWIKEEVRRQRKPSAHLDELDTRPVRDGPPNPYCAAQGCCFHASLLEKCDMQYKEDS